MRGFLFTGVRPDSFSTRAYINKIHINQNQLWSICTIIHEQFISAKCSRAGRRAWPGDLPRDYQTYPWPIVDWCGHSAHLAENDLLTAANRRHKIATDLCCRWAARKGGTHLCVQTSKSVCFHSNNGRY